ncbi:FmdE family protein [Desulfuromonas acetexigens]|nr:FmdE family protein [Desulfuromonas acetexigens]
MSIGREFFADIYALHGHRCPMSTLGGRLGRAATAHVDSLRRRAVYHIDTCALDGIRVATGCHEIRVVDEGRHVLDLFDDRNGRGVRVALRPEALAIAGEYRRLDDALDRDRAGLDPTTLAARQSEVNQVLDKVLEQLWTLPDEVLLEIAPTELDPVTLLER